MSGALALAGLLLAAGPPSVAAGSPPPIASFQDLGTALTACVRGDAPAAGLELEIRLVLTARGVVAGKPAIATNAAISPALQRDLKATVLDALRRCTPFALAPDFAHTIAGRPLTLRLLTGGRAILV